MILTGNMAKIGLFSGIATLLLVGFVCVPSIGMNSQIDGTMNNCPFMPGVSICTMTPLEHIAASQSMFNALPLEKDFSLILSVMLATLLLARSILKLSALPPRFVRAHNYSSYQEYMPLHHYLQEAFSSGILNPRIA